MEFNSSKQTVSPYVSLFVVHCFESHTFSTLDMMSFK
jgi:hypothetical protein